MNKKREWLKLWNNFKTSGSFVVLVWACSCWIFVGSWERFVNTKNSKMSDPGAIATVLFGASSLALFIFSLLVAVLAIVGWQSIKEHISKNVSEEVALKTQSFADEIRGRVATVLGYAIGEMGLQPGTFEADDPDRLAEAVYQCEAGYKFLKKVGGGAEFLGLNNFIYYKCILSEVSPDKDKDNSAYVLTQARLLRDAGEKHNSPMLQLTAARVFFEYEAATSKERIEAWGILRSLAREPTIQQRERKEAEYYMKKYLSKYTSIIAEKQLRHRRSPSTP